VLLLASSLSEPTLHALSRPEGKPSPQPVLELMRRLGVDASECLLIEDSKNGVLAGIRAGVRVIWVTSDAKAGTPLLDHGPELLALQNRGAEVWVDEDMSSFVPHMYGFPAYESNVYALPRK
jgi:beta-phosphoglucomutase-like phosphatase (HAD superfamily)